MEKRFVTNAFGLRFFTTMFGCVDTNIFFAHRYYKDGKAEFAEVMRQVAMSLIYNDLRAEKEQDESAAPEGFGSASYRSGSVSVIDLSPRARALAVQV